MPIEYARDYWQDGSFVSVGHPAMYDGYGLADGVFETVAFRQNRLERWEAHVARLRRALDFFRLRVTHTEEALEASAKTLLEAAPPGRDYRLRITVARRGGGASVTMAYAPIGPAPAGVVLVASDIIRVAGNPSSQFKTLAYVDHLVAQRDLATGQMALLCNQWGRVACATYANVFVERDGRWVTPSVAEGALPGVVRGEWLGEGAVEGQVEVEELREGRIFVTNSLMGRVAGGFKAREPPRTYSTRITGNLP